MKSPLKMSKKSFLGGRIGSVGAEKFNFRKVNKCKNSYYSIYTVSRLMQHHQRPPSKQNQPLTKKFYEELKTPDLGFSRTENRVSWSRLTLGDFLSVNSLSVNN